MHRRILLIDDDKDDRELFTEAVANADASVTYHTAEDAAEALRRLNSGDIEIPDLIFLDINLPDMSGWECLTRLKRDERYKAIPVIMYSTSSHQRDKDIAKDLGAVCLLTKPDNYKKLEEVLRMALRENLPTLK